MKKIDNRFFNVNNVVIYRDDLNKKQQKIWLKKANEIYSKEKDVDRAVMLANFVLEPLIID